MVRENSYPRFPLFAAVSLVAVALVIGLVFFLYQHTPATAPGVPPPSPAAASR